KGPHGDVAYGVCVVGIAPATNRNCRRCIAIVSKGFEVREYAVPTHTHTGNIDPILINIIFINYIRDVLMYFLSIPPFIMTLGRNYNRGMLRVPLSIFNQEGWSVT